MRIIRFTQLFKWRRIQKTLPFLFLPNANLNSDFQNCIAFGEVSKARHETWQQQHTYYVSSCSANKPHFDQKRVSYVTRTETLRYKMATTTYCHLLVVHNATRQTPVPNVCTNSSYESCGGSVGGIFTSLIKSTNAYVWNMFHHVLLITNMFPSFLRSSSGLLYKRTKNTIICHTEYLEPINVIINVSNNE